MPTTGFAMSRAPALYFAGRSDDTDTVYLFRLPYPPPARSTGGQLVRALERRAKRAYFAACDALSTGQSNGEQMAKLSRLTAEVTSPPLRSAFAHLLRVIRAAERAVGEGPLLSLPATPLSNLAAMATPTWTGVLDAGQARVDWALEWLTTRGYVAKRGLDIRWISGSAPPAQRIAALLSALTAGAAPDRHPTTG